MMNTLHSLLDRLRRDRGGNFGIMTAILLPVLIGAAGFAIDTMNIMASQRQLQEAADAGALAAASALSAGKVTTDDQAKTLAKDFVIGQMANHVDAATISALETSTAVSINTTTSSGGKSYKISVNASYPLSLTPFMNVLGFKTSNIAAAGTSTGGISQERSAVSMTLVLDESGSMLANTGTKIVPTTSCKQYNTSGQSIGTKSPCYIKKIEALKTAANLLLDQLDKADPQSKYVRTNAIAWSGSIQDSNSFNWGTSKTRTEVINTMSAGGNTESSVPMEKAYNGLNSTGGGSESKIQADAGNNKLTKYIVFMTDGENNNSASDTKTLATCANAKKDGIKIYSIAFMAPEAGKNLLSTCASGPTYYFQAESMNDLIAAFQAIGQNAAADKTLLTQ
ncbi:Flp pilus assembly protein TadG [Rhizobium sp. BK377]|nr:Flp pilus assembly protein TadG [Rhizobium sp. BK377]